MSLPNPHLKSWVEIPENSDFSIHNLPFGIFKTKELHARAGVAIGAHILDLSAVARLGFFKDFLLNNSVFSGITLNPFIELGKPIWRAVRNRVQELLTVGNNKLKPYESQVLIPMQKAQMLMPIKVENYTDFYSSEEHATNVGIMFRGKENALMPNWKHLPVAYHGRASSIVVSGTPIHRPKGQFLPKGESKPIFGASQKMDFELEVGFIVGKNSKLGQNISTAEAEDYIFGFVLFNDWSARDIQQWEYQPLGPFLGKNFGSALSAWVVSLDALEPFRIPSPEQSPEVLPYLQYEGNHNFDIQLEVEIEPQNVRPRIVSKSNFKYLYWNICQQIAHHTINGCNVCVGDLYASGTISGKSPNSFGSLLELTWNGQNPIPMFDQTERIYLNDYDTVRIRGFAENFGIRVGFGEVFNQILPSL